MPLPRLFGQPFRVVFGQPGDQEIEAAFPALAADARPPAWPAFDQAAVAQQADDFGIGRVFQQAQGGPILPQTANREFTGEHGLKIACTEVVIPG